jgi:hypothetical protein
LVLAPKVARQAEEEDRSMNSPRRSAMLFAAFLAATILFTVAGIAWAVATTVH